MEDDGCRYEVIQGELLMAPAPNRFHQGISRNLCFLLVSYLRKNKIGKAYNAPFDVYLDDFNVVQPDVIFVADPSLDLGFKPNSLNPMFLQPPLVEPYIAVARLQLATQRTEQGALAGAIGPQHAEHFTRTQFQVDIRQHRARAALYRQIFRAQHQVRPRSNK